ncbi:DISARM system phospholipase D-like protein DrmC [Lyngbya confervoides]|uniref:DISARM system phospholipase D-like protein DrmC n=1 Tax=Lyngbya confervoides BDU141951 TaxID=1574623 RepID=A0ABD4T5N7_9CYAN|nr:DISARM system phospholipase D-like protein DrmC [Lyngbya confervoides]MCM1983979.1 DISARM system phospholipase D-like protein DrmC [Lyngbya confervoides BDU141951]
MTELPTPLLDQIFVAATLLPKSTIEMVVEHFSHQDNPAEVLFKLPNPLWRRTISEVLEVWNYESPHLSQQTISCVLETAHYTIQKSAEKLAVEIVWTGPNISKIPVRQTEQVLLQMIKNAKMQLIICSFAIYKVSELSNALLAAVHRGVAVTIIAETSEHKENVPFGVEQGLGSQLTAAAKVYEWPRDIRPADHQGRSGSLHMKVAIADAQHLFITSANLTEYAMSLNMEMGLLIHSHDLAKRVQKHLDELILQNILQRIN